jgi:hypothetical protein
VADGTATVSFSYNDNAHLGDVPAHTSGQAGLAGDFGTAPDTFDDFTITTPEEFYILLRIISLRSEITLRAIYKKPVAPADKQISSKPPAQFMRLPTLV